MMDETKARTFFAEKNLTLILLEQTAQGMVQKYEAMVETASGETEIWSWNSTFCKWHKD